MEKCFYLRIYFSDAIKASPHGLDSFRGRGRVWAAMREFDRAIADFDEAKRLKADPDAWLYE